MAFYLVTGGLGFIGSHLCAALTAIGHKVRILDDLSTGRRENAAEGAEVIIGDVGDEDQVRKAISGVDGCFHLAAIASVQKGNEEWLATHRTNLGGTIAVLDAARFAKDSAPIPVVYASSAAVYGDNQDVPLKESAKTTPLSAYGADKLGSELHAFVATYVHQVPTTGMRFFNVYGPRQDPKSPYSGVIAIFADRLSGRQPIQIFGDGAQARDFIYVEDIVRFLVAAMTSSKGARIFNACTGRETSILHLARTMAEIKGLSPDIRYCEARAGDILRSLGDPSAAAAALGVTAGVTLRDGLAETLRWIDQSRPA